MDEDFRSSLKLAHWQAVCLLTCGVLLSGCSGSQTVRGSMVDVDVSKWDVLGNIEVRFEWYPVLAVDEELTESYRIPVYSTARYWKFRIVVHEWAATITKLWVILDNGEMWEPEAKGFYKKDSASDIIDIPSESPDEWREARSIKEVFVEFKTLNQPPVRSTFVYFWGERRN